MTDEKLVKKVTGDVMRLLEENSLSAGEKALFIRKLADSLADSLNKSAPGTDLISAHNAVVEILDQSSGIIYRRYLELSYDENDNGIRLIGEDITGREAQIAFLSESALQKLHELRGGGPDSPRCHD